MHQDETRENLSLAAPPALETLGLDPKRVLEQLAEQAAQLSPATLVEGERRPREIEVVAGIRAQSESLK